MSRTATQRLLRILHWYKRRPSSRLFEQLVEGYLPLVRPIAQRLRGRLPSGVEVDDLVSEGTEGLMQAIRLYDPARTTTFEAFCQQRVRGAMLDYLRVIDVLPRGLRRRQKEIEEACNRFRVEVGRPPSDEELAKQLGMTGRKLLAVQRHIRTGMRIGLSSAVGRGDAPTGELLVSTVADRRAERPEQSTSQRMFREMVARGFDRTERLILVLYYYENLTMAEIGVVLGMCEARVSQIHKLIMARLRARMTDKSFARQVVAG